jgi:hypothetical protein
VSAANPTPGPWEVSDAHGLCVHRGEIGVADLDSNGFSKKPSNKASRANALLIAAAPELLAALKDAVDGLEYLKREYGTGFQNRIDAANAAIKKARGE